MRCADVFDKRHEVVYQCWGMDFRNNIDYNHKNGCITQIEHVVDGEWVETGQWFTAEMLSGLRYKGGLDNYARIILDNLHKLWVEPGPVDVMNMSFAKEFEIEGYKFKLVRMEGFFFKQGKMHISICNSMGIWEEAYIVNTCAHEINDEMGSNQICDILNPMLNEAMVFHAKLLN